MRLFLSLLVALLLCGDTFGQGVKIPPEVDKEEIVRRGNMVQELGTQQEGPNDLIADAIAPPEDDSHKWYITLVTIGDGTCKPCEAIKSDFIKTDELRAWANLTDPDKSWSHFQVRRYEDSDPEKGSQRDWFKGVREKIKEGFDKVGAPCLVIQPPRNCEFGPNRMVVSMLFGYDGDAAKTSRKIRAAISTYVVTMRDKGLLTHVGPNRQNKTPEGGARCNANDKEENPICVEPSKPIGTGQQVIGAPPFTIPPKNVDLNLPNGPIDIPAPKPQTLTLQQLQQIAPNAPADFYLACMQNNVADVQMVQLLWLQYQQQNAPPVDSDKEPHDHPTLAPVPLWTLIQTLSGAGCLIGFAIVAFLTARQIRTTEAISQTTAETLRICRKFDPDWTSTTTSTTSSTSSDRY